jgi:hypothetical protein
MKDYKVKMGFGLHIGWGIEGNLLSFVFLLILSFNKIIIAFDEIIY